MEDKIIIDFLATFSVVSRQQLQKVIIRLNKDKMFKKVTEICRIWKLSDDPSEKVRFVGGIDADCLVPINNEFHCAEMTFDIFKEEGKWIFEGVVGWCGYDVGFTPIDSIEQKYGNLYQLLDNVEKDVSGLIAKYNTLINGFRESNSLPPINLDVS